MPASLVGIVLWCMPKTWDHISPSLGTLCVSLQMRVLWRRLLRERGGGGLSPSASPTIANEFFFEEINLSSCSIYFQIYFQSMVMDGINMAEENAFGGEIEIERFPTHIIEARSKDLIPVFDYLQTPKFQQARCVKSYLCLPILLILRMHVNPFFTCTQVHIFELFGS